MIGLDDLLALPTMAGHAQAAKLRAHQRACPARPGVYLFRDRGGRVLYVGKATNLRSRVRSYFSGDDRRKVGQLLRETQRHRPPRAAPPRSRPRCARCASSTSTTPRFNRQAKDWQRYAYLKLTLNEPFPRLSVVRVARDDGALYLGPLPSTRVGQAGGRGHRDRGAAAPLHGHARAARPRDGAVRRGPARRGHLPVRRRGQPPPPTPTIVDRAVRGPAPRPDAAARAAARSACTPLAAEQRFEEAADVRDRAAALAQALRRQRRLDGLFRAGRVVVEVRGGGGPSCTTAACVRCGRRSRRGPRASTVPRPRRHCPSTTPRSRSAAHELRLVTDDGPEAALPRELADELTCVATWLDSHAQQVSLLSAERGLASPLPRLPSFDPRTPADAARRARR